MARDLLADWWVHQATVRRLVGSGDAGDVYAPAEPADPAIVTGFYRDGAKLVTDRNGREVVSTAQFAHPATDARIPVGSVFTAPARFGGGTSKVIESKLGDGGGQPTPDHYEIALQ